MLIPKPILSWSAKDRRESQILSFLRSKVRKYRQLSKMSHPLFSPAPIAQVSNSASWKKTRMRHSVTLQDEKSDSLHFGGHVRNPPLLLRTFGDFFWEEERGRKKRVREREDGGDFWVNCVYIYLSHFLSPYSAKLSKTRLPRVSILFANWTKSL